MAGTTTRMLGLLFCDSHGERVQIGGVQDIEQIACELGWGKVCLPPGGYTDSKI
ncbi:hypothetical protein SAMN05421811_1365 [Nonomuraea wenchangensis]|uniref:Uncharacterized protein n=1 Tax=Nonomuraea wenchangensis TaxID=568860 RepID=A0A1I0LXM9_9ACTN|nr:hypothetical protein SAMN05421811_1365 [Nonomuraea wenchangensis]